MYNLLEYLEINKYTVELWEAEDRITDNSEDAWYVYDENGECVGYLENSTIIYNNGEIFTFENYD